MSFFWLLSIVVYIAFEHQFGGFFTFLTSYFLLFGTVLAVGHFLIAYFRSIDRELKKLDAKPIDSGDRYHQLFRNIIDELEIAAGGKDFDGYVISSEYRTALSLEDRNQCAIILTEGTIGCLERSELQGVVAHEAAHVAYGDTRIKTFMENIMSTIESITGVAEPDVNVVDVDGGQTRYGSTYGLGSGEVSTDGIMVVALATVYTIIGRLLRTTVSRTQETRADARAVEYNRNPIALARTLYKLGFYYKYNPSRVHHYQSSPRLKKQTYEALQVVPVDPGKLEKDGSGNGDSSGWFENHPPLDLRLNRLLDLAAESMETLENQVDFDSTEPFSHRRVEFESGRPAVEEEFHVKVDDKTEGPVRFSRLMEPGIMDPQTQIGLADGEEFRPMESIPLFQDLLQMRKEEGGGFEQSCPNCNGPLTDRTWLGVQLDECFICGGVGLKQDDLFKITCRFETALTNEKKEDLNEKYIEGINPAQETGRTAELDGNCPDCGNEFLLKNFRGDTGVLIDTCEVCAYTWFDYGELPTACQLTQLSYDQKSMEYLDKLS
ncbi:MAG: M48 family metalloprotease [bacterium]